MLNNFLASSSLFGLLLASKAWAGIYVTNPVAETVAQSGQTLTINWVDDGVYPLLGNIGASSIALFTGSTFEQSWLANIAEEIDVSKVGTVNWAIDPNVGPSGNYYFIRFSSKNLKDSAEAAYPHTAYSAKFTLQNMSGSFNGTILSQLNATSSAASSGAGANVTSTGAGATGTGASQGGASSSGSNATSSAGDHKSSVADSMSTSATLPRSTSSGSMTRSSPASATSNSAQSASQSSGSANSAAAFSRELSHAGIGAVVLGCMGLGLALCL